MHLLDVNVLIARADSSHPHHDLAMNWMAGQREGWATCPITENGMLRILASPRYPGNGTGSPEIAAAILQGLVAAISGHEFFPDDLSLPGEIPSLSGIRSTELTDVYLLALAVRHGIKFLSLDRKIDPGVVPGGSQAFELLS